MKPETRILGIEDSPFGKFSNKTASVIGCLSKKTDTGIHWWQV